MLTSADDIILTPTARLARNLSRELALGNRANGQNAWLPTPVYTFSAWLSQLREHYLLTADDSRIPINAAQAQVIWQSLVDEDVFIGEPQVAGLAQTAWRTVHEYRLPQPADWPELSLSQDSRLFRQWANDYLATCAERDLLDEWVFAASIPELVSSGAFAIPKSIELVGFERNMTPLQLAIIEAFAGGGAEVRHAVQPQPRDEPLAVMACIEPDDELTAAALWARELLQDNAACSIAVVVPDLNGRVDRVERLFRQAFDPPGFTQQANDPEAWHISLGKPLSNWPLVAEALSLLALSADKINQPQIAQLVRSPFLGGVQQEAQARSLCLAMLNQRAPYDLTIREFRWALQQSNANALASSITTWETHRQEAPGRLWPSQWVGRFQSELSLLGFAQGRGLDSREYQILQRWHDLLETVGALDMVLDAPISRRQALSLVNEHAANVVFRERNPGVPVEILGVEEALGSHFDALWITTLDSETWPGATRRDALIPAALQADLPRATSDGCVAQATQELTGLLHAAPVLQGSYAQGLEENALQLTSLLGPYSLRPMPIQPTPPSAEMDPAQDDHLAPPLVEGRVAGGTAVLRHQSSCPFRAFAQHRLGAIDQIAPRPGLDAGQRGSITHTALEQFWQGLHDHAELVALDPQALAARIDKAVEYALKDFTRNYRLTLSATGYLLEQRRTAKVVTNWLDLERQRSDFKVLAHELELHIELAGFRLRGSIDRVDELPDGTTMLIDYKTGRTSKADWVPQPRLVDPQLPTYAIAIQPEPHAITFAQIRPDRLSFEGLAEADTGTPGVGALADEGYSFKDLNSWPQLMTSWRTHVSALAAEFAAGQASVDPRHPSECNRCHLHSLCRVHERAPYDSLEEEPPGE